MLGSPPSFIVGSRRLRAQTFRRRISGLSCGCCCSTKEKNSECQMLLLVLTLISQTTEASGVRRVRIGTRADSTSCSWTARRGQSETLLLLLLFGVLLLLLLLGVLLLLLLG